MSSSWEKIVKKHPEANFLQSPANRRMNEILGDKVLEFNFDADGYAIGIVRDAKRGRYLEVPCGPLIDWGNKKIVRAALSEICEAARAEKCVFVRIRPQLISNPKNLAILKDMGLRKSPMHLAAEHTVMIDLERSEEEMLAAMRRQTRYEVRRAEKLGIKVSRENSEEIFREFHKVQVATAKRQGFVPPSLKVLLAEREAFGENISIYVARISDSGTESEMKQARKDLPKNAEEVARKDLPKQRAIAYGLVIADGLEGDYYEAASTELNRKLPGAYAIIWRAMRDLKTSGYKRFNLWGIAPAGQPNHRYAGVTTFKTGFGGEIVEYVPAHDLVISKVGYLKNLIVEKARKKRRRL